MKVEVRSTLEVADALRAERDQVDARLRELRARAAQRDVEEPVAKALRLLGRDDAAEGLEEEARRAERRLRALDGALDEIADAARQAAAARASEIWLAAVPEVVARRREAEAAAAQLIAAVERVDAALAGARLAGAAAAPAATTFGGRNAAALGEVLRAFAGETDAMCATTPAGDRPVEVRLLSDRSGIGAAGQTVSLTARDALALVNVGAAEVSAKELQSWREKSAKPSASAGSRAAGR